jgi:hypothetical protein
MEEATVVTVHRRRHGSSDQARHGVQLSPDAVDPRVTPGSVGRRALEGAVRILPGRAVRGVRFLRFDGSLIAMTNILLGFRRFFFGMDVVAATVLATYTSTVFSG